MAVMVTNCRRKTATYVSAFSMPGGKILEQQQFLLTECATLFCVASQPFKPLQTDIHLQELFFTGMHTRVLAEAKFHQSALKEDISLSPSNMC